MNRKKRSIIEHPNFNVGDRVIVEGFKFLYNNTAPPITKIFIFGSNSLFNFIKSSSKSYLVTYVTRLHTFFLRHKDLRVSNIFPDK